MGGCVGSYQCTSMDGRMGVRIWICGWVNTIVHVNQYIIYDKIEEMLNLNCDITVKASQCRFNNFKMTRDFGRGKSCVETVR